MITSISMPRTADIKKYVDCDIQINGGELMPFTALPDDAQGAEIYRQALAGKYGEIAISPSTNHRWDGRQWSPIPQSNLTEIAEGEKARKFTLANAEIAPLQDAQELGIATDQEVKKLAAWKKYRVMLNRIDTSSAPHIDWPVAP